MVSYCTTYRYAHSLCRISRLASIHIASNGFVQVSFTDKKRSLPVAHEAGMRCDVTVSCYNVTVSSRTNKHGTLLACANTETLHHSVPADQDLLCIAMQSRWP
jgi:hypothetical protein